MTSVYGAFAQLQDLLFNPIHSKWVSVLLLLFDGVLTGLIVKKIPYTEIDWVAYMQQIKSYREGERNYANIHGQTGPLVYPAGHVHLYNQLFNVTDEGTDIFRAQCIFVIVYLTALSIVMACYRSVKAPPYLFGLLVLSKRLHSIFVLRLFNDCFAVLCLFSAIYFYQLGLFVFGSLAFSLGVSVKMSILLAAPGVGCLLLQALPSRRAINMGMIMLQVQVILAIPFLSVNAWAYLTRSFELNRQFLFKWTVNWRFVDESVFSSKGFASALLVANMVLMLVFLYTRWLRPSGLDPLSLAKTIFSPLPIPVQEKISKSVGPRYTMTAMLSSLGIGLLCARSLHYQFYAYVAWSTPFLLWRSKLPAPLVVTLWAIQELAWNVYPSTKQSSLAVVASLALQVFGVWWGTRNEVSEEEIAMQSCDSDEAKVS